MAVISVELLSLWLSSLTVVLTQHVSPFFYLCSFQQPLDQSSDNVGQVALSVTIDGDPQFYIPGQLYNGKMFLSARFLNFSYTNCQVDKHSVFERTLIAISKPTAVDRRASIGLADSTKDHVGIGPCKLYQRKQSHGEKQKQHSLSVTSMFGGMGPMQQWGLPS